MDGMGALTVHAAPRVDQAARHRGMHWPRYSLAGTVVALLFACASFTPSLLPRAWGLQALVDGLSAAFGYGIGVLLAWLVRTITRRTFPPRVTRRLWLLVAVFGAPLVAWTLWWGQHWQAEVHRLTGAPVPGSYQRVRILLLTVVVFAVVVGIGRLVRWLVQRVTGRLTRLMPGWVAQVVAILVVVLVVVVVNNGLVRNGLVSLANSISSAANGVTTAGTVRPTSPMLSGSPASLVSWSSLGRQGRDFVALGPKPNALAAFSGTPAEQPIRVYVGLKSARTERARAELAVRELRRTGAFDRKVLVVATTTGTGLVDPAAINALEYMYNGDVATVATQYSYLPSWISFLVDQQKAERAGREEFDAVYAAWSKLPAGHRPKLLVTGGSLGAFGSQAAFHSLSDVRHRTDGAVWAGSPEASVLSRQLRAHRDPGSPAWLPVYRDGRGARFAATPADLARPAAPWTRPRVLFLQHGSDPVVFWSPRLMFEKPAWLSEPRAPDVSPGMRWFPFVTFWQVTADLPFAISVPPGHGHSYRLVYVDAWAAVAPPPGWTAEDTRRLRELAGRWQFQYSPMSRITDWLNTL
jgi:uncharacterized membrane protein